MISSIRHKPVLDPEKFRMGVEVIGCGAVGSKIASELGKMGINQVRVSDGDVIEEQNVANQNFAITDVGKPKADALKEWVKRHTGIEYTSVAEFIKEPKTFYPIVFVTTDTMKSRKDIWEQSIRLKPHVRLMIETRMHISEGRVYAVDPCNPEHIKAWESTLRDDADTSDAVDPVCGLPISIGATAAFTASLAVWQLIRWNKYAQGKAPRGPEYETIYSLDPPQFVTRSLGG